MQIQAENTASVAAETVEAKAQLQVALARIAELENALRKAKAHFLDNNPIKAFVEVCTALAFSDQSNSTALGKEK